MKNTLLKNQEVFFVEENLPYKVNLTSERFVICSRNFDQNEDNGHLVHAVETGAYSSIIEAYENYKDYPVYTILDLKENIRGGDNCYTAYDYSNDEECKDALLDLESGDLEISHRSRIELNINWEKTVVFNEN